MWPDKVAAGLLKVLYFIWKFLGLLALDYDFKKKLFLTSTPATIMSCVICVFVALASPILVKWNVEIYSISGVDMGENLSFIASAQFAFSFATSFVVLVCQIWKRHSVSRTANRFRKVFHQLESELEGRDSIVTPQIILLVVMKCSITVYEILVNFPYIIEVADFMSPWRFLAFFLNVYIVEIAAVFSDITFAVLQLLARYFCLVNELLEALRVEIEATKDESDESVQEIKQRLLRLIRLYLQMRRMLHAFARCVEISVFVQTLNSFTNFLSNLYALLDFYAGDKTFDTRALVYNVMILVNICFLVHAAEKVERSSTRLRDTFLELDAGGRCRGLEWGTDELVFKLWPETLQVSILGMFPLNNTFLLFLFSYATNFVVIILQFGMTNILLAHRKDK